MRSLKDVRYALDGNDSPWSVLDSVKRGAWPAVPKAPDGRVSLDQWCRRFASAGRELRLLADDDPNVWARIDRRDVVDQLRRRIRNPGIMDQRPTDLCGPFSLLMEFARRRPGLYVRAAAELLRVGVFTTLSGSKFTAADDLRDRPVPDGVADADWLFAATIVDDENVFDDVDDGEWLEGLTWPFWLEQWIEDVLGLKGDYHPCWFEDEMEELKKGQAAVQAGGVAFLLIDNGLVHREPDNTEERVWMRSRDFAGGGRGNWTERVHCEDDSYVYPNHYVVLLGELEGWNSTTNFRVCVWSFGAEYEITGSGEGFGEYLYGVITGTP